MVSLLKRTKKGYYVLIHNSGRHQYEKYLGKKIPKNIEMIKRDFLLSIFRREWKSSLDNIQKGYLDRPKQLIEDQLKEFSFGFTHDTQKIEGSTLTRKETYELLKYSLTPRTKPESDMVEAKMHHMTYLKMVENPPALSKRVLLAWHREMFGKTKPEFAGKIRNFRVFVTDSESKFPHWKFVPKFLGEFLAWYKKSERGTEPVELAACAHFRFVSIHPFGDGNGRISRLLMNYTLIKNNRPPLNIRFADRRGYYKALEKSQVLLDETYFLKWFMKYYIKANKKYHTV